MSAKSITSAFLDILSETITSVLACRECCLVNPDSDFTRNRSCLDLQMVFKAPFLFADASVTSCLPELLELSKNSWQDIPWDSALTQARAKILPEAYGRVFHLFNEKPKAVICSTAIPLLPLMGLSSLSEPEDRAVSHQRGRRENCI